MARSAALIVLFPCLALARPLPEAYQQAAKTWRVPVELLWAVAQTESGSQFGTQRLPWPWTLNIAGKSYRYASESQACNALLAAAERTRLKNIDVGLGQINIGWHRALFASPCDVLAPDRNINLTARLLRERYDEQPGSWLHAAARYHHPAGGAPAAGYRQRIRQALAQSGDTL